MFAQAPSTPGLLTCIQLADVQACGRPAQGEAEASSRHCLKGVTGSRQTDTEAIAVLGEVRLPPPPPTMLTTYFSLSIASQSIKLLFWDVSFVWEETESGRQTLEKVKQLLKEKSRLSRSCAQPESGLRHSSRLNLAFSLELAVTTTKPAMRWSVSKSLLCPHRKSRSFCAALRLQSGRLNALTLGEKYRRYRP